MLVLKVVMIILLIILGSVIIYGVVLIELNTRSAQRQINQINEEIKENRDFKTT